MEARVFRPPAPVCGGSLADVDGSTRTHPDSAAATDLSWLGHVRSTLVLGLPLIGTQLAQMATSVTDTVMIGWLGAAELAAVVLATRMFFLFWMFGSGILQALMPLAAAAEGRGDGRGVRRVVRMGFWMVAAYGALAMVPLWHTEGILLVLGQDPEVAAIAGRFTRVVRSEEHTSELQSLMRISYAVFCLKTKKENTSTTETQV